MKKLAIILGVMILLAQAAQASELKVLTFNTWGISDGRNKKERFALIPGAVSELSPDIIIFQEVFEEWERTELKAGLVKAGYPADGFRYFPLRYGTGIMVVSRYPITDEKFEPYQAFKWPENKESLGRGMAVLRIQAPGGDVLLATTHITPGNLADLQRSEGMLEFYEMAKLIFEQSAKTGVKNMLMAGDLNADPPKLIYHIFPALTGFKNVYSFLHNGQFAPTNDRRENPNTIMGIEAIDHIFFGNLPGASTGLAPKTAQVVLDHAFKAADGKEYFLSDHFGMLAVFDWSTQAPQIMSAPVLMSADLSGDEKNWLLNNLKPGATFVEKKELWTRLGLAVLSGQDQSHKRDAGLIEAADRLLIGLSGDRQFKASDTDIKILRQWLETRK
jgi:endonuclease/exonuclease/phosphatase family metal-dependent hydrolase